LDYYQTATLRNRGAEMPSAGRAFTWKLLFDLKRRGVETAYVPLHTGLSSYMDDSLDAHHPASEKNTSSVRQQPRRLTEPILLKADE